MRISVLLRFPRNAVYGAIYFYVLFIFPKNNCFYLAFPSNLFNKLTWDALTKHFTCKRSLPKLFFMRVCKIPIGFFKITHQAYHLFITMQSFFYTFVKMDIHQIRTFLFFFSYFILKLLLFWSFKAQYIQYNKQ
jgi:hypothetical protein